MSTLTASEKRTIRFAAIGLGIFLAAFFGWKLLTPLRERTAAYGALLAHSQDLQQDLQPYGDRAAAAQRLMDHYHLDPGKLNRVTVVGLASEEIQKTAAGSGVQVGVIRESPTKNAAREMATLQFEGSGAVPSVLGLLKRMETLGYPIVIDSVQITPDTMRPDQLKLAMTLVILDFDQWKTGGKAHA